MQKTHSTPFSSQSVTVNPYSGSTYHFVLPYIPLLLLPATMRIDDLIITIAYFSIPVQILAVSTRMAVGRRASSQRRRRRENVQKALFFFGDDDVSMSPPYAWRASFFVLLRQATTTSRASLLSSFGHDSSISVTHSLTFSAPFLLLLVVVVILLLIMSSD